MTNAFVASLTFATLAAAALPAQAPSPPSDSGLAAITARGRALLNYDIASWHGGDALATLQPAASDLNAGFAQQLGSGRWELLFGRLTAAKDTFFITYRITQSNDDSAFSGEKLVTPQSDTHLLREKALAMATATADFGRVTRPYNTYILPAPAGGFFVYLVPAQTDSRVFPVGGDVRYRIVDGTTIAEKLRFHTAILDRLPPPGKAIAGLAHTHLSGSPPSETDVFLVLRRWPKVPEFIATDSFFYQIDVDGKISWVAVKKSGQGP